MMRWLKCLDRNAFIVILGVAVLMAWYVPAFGKDVSREVVDLLVVVIFLCQGTAVAHTCLQEGRRLSIVLLWGFCISHLLAPVFGWLVVPMMPLTVDAGVGLMIMCCMAPSLVTGVVIAARAGGDVTSAILLTIALNMVGVITIPFNLYWTLGAQVALSQWELLLKLLTLVLLPASIGFGLRQWQFKLVMRLSPCIRYIPMVAVGTIVFVSCASQHERLQQVSIGFVSGVVAGSLLVHLFLLLVAYAGARLLHIGIADARSIAIVCSQKTLPIALTIWLLAFAVVYPLAVLPLVLFHFSQLACDSTLAVVWGDR